jgi:hypothetical protein
MAKKKKVLKNLVEKNSSGFCGKTRNPDEDRLLRKLDARRRPETHHDTLMHSLRIR